MGLIQSHFIALWVRCENRVWNDQVWTNISLLIFNENEPNFYGWCINTQKIEKLICFPNILKKILLKQQKNLLGVLSQGKSGVKKIVFKNGKHFRKCVFCDNTPKYWKNAFKVWKIKITNIFPWICQRGQMQIFMYSNQLSLSKHYFILKLHVSMFNVK